MNVGRLFAIVFAVLATVSIGALLGTVLWAIAHDWRRYR